MSFDLASAAASFDQQGFVVIPDALSPPELASLQRAFERHVRAFPAEWTHHDESFVQTLNVLPHTSDFDIAIENANVLRLLRHLIGDDVTFEEMSLMIRNPTRRETDVKGWHRDTIRDYSRRHEITALSVVYYLTDVTERDHCLSIIPGSHGPRVDLRPEEVVPGMEADIIGPAGSAAIFHTRCIHAGKLKAGSAMRRTMHLYYSRFGAPRLSEYTDIPPRLTEKRDPSLPPHLYAKAAVREVVDGVGRKPRAG
jgi:ectoine hydroxylase-related dioxygenase (phytanoyl-CoA dioxygenase family)